MTKKDLVEKIAALEKRVQELESRPAVEKHIERHYERVVENNPPSWQQPGWPNWYTITSNVADFHRSGYCQS